MRWKQTGHPSHSLSTLRLRSISPNLIRLCAVCAVVPSLSTFFFFNSPSYADFSGSVVSISDGDTIKVLHDNQPERIRLQGIDCPEKGQPYGNRAKQATSTLVFGKAVTIQTYGLDKYGRTISDVLLPDGTNVNHELVKNGWCWWYRKYAPNDTELERFENKAREDRKGLWNDPQPIPPWVYRKIGKKNGMPPSGLVPLDKRTER